MHRCQNCSTLLFCHGEWWHRGQCWALTDHQLKTSEESWVLSSTLCGHQILSLICARLPLPKNPDFILSLIRITASTFNIWTWYSNVNVGESSAQHSFNVGTRLELPESGTNQSRWILENEFQFDYLPSNLSLVMMYGLGSGAGPRTRRSACLETLGSCVTITGPKNIDIGTGMTVINPASKCSVCLKHYLLSGPESRHNQSPRDISTHVSRPRGNLEIWEESSEHCSPLETSTLSPGIMITHNTSLLFLLNILLQTCLHY